MFTLFICFAYKKKCLFLFCGTFDREVNALLNFSDVQECRRMLIITRDTEQSLKFNDKTIEVIPVWKWLINTEKKL